MVKKKQRVVLPPELPPEIADDDIEVSDEDLEFVEQNKDYAGFVSSLDTQSITKHVNRVADANEDALEALYEKRLRKKFLERQNEESKLPQVDPVDALPIKNLDGTLHYRTAPKTPKESENAPNEGDDVGDDVDGGGDMSLAKLTKPERRAKLKKSKKDAKKQTKELAKTGEVQQTQQAEVLAEVQKDLTAEEACENKKHRLAELGMALLADPESNIKSLKEMLQLFKDGDHVIIKLGMLSLLAVFKDIIPGYRIRLPTDKELEMTVSKDVKKMRYYESTLLSSYKAYLQKLISLEQQSPFQQVAVRCLCNLLEAVPHFNFRDSLLSAVIRKISSSDDVIRKLCCASVKSLFTNEGKHGGEATVEAVRLIAGHVKVHNCQLHPDSIEMDSFIQIGLGDVLINILYRQVFLSLSFNEDLGRPEVSNKDKNVKKKKTYRKINPKEPNQLQENDKKKSRKELKAKMRDEVDADFKAAAFTPDIMEQRRMQSETLSAVFQTYFRILKHTMQLITARSEGNDNLSAGVAGAHPLLYPCLNGLGKFAHLIDLDFMSSLMSYLKKLASGGSNPTSPSENSLKTLTVSERLRCCIVAFKVMRNNLDALNVDLQDFFVQLYNLVLEYRPGRDQGEVLAEALKIMLCEDRQHDMQKAAAFIKRLATFSLCFGSAESMAALVTLKHLLLKNSKCRNLLENDAGGGSVSGSVAKYQPYASDPNLSGALASVLWELNLLSKHYHPTVSTMASSITSMNTENQVYIAIQSPQQAFMDLSLERDSFLLKNDTKKLNHKRKRGVPSVTASTGESPEVTTPNEEDGIRKKLSEHFIVLRDIHENWRLRGELDRTTLSLKLYEEYKDQKRKKKDTPKLRKLK